MNTLKNKNLLLCVTGSIAAYKACELLRLLRKEGANVQVMMSNAAEEFVGKASFAALSNNEVLTNLFPKNPSGGLKHVNLAFEIDALIVAPATANIVCKAAGGIADDIVSTTLSICNVPKLFAPAMNFNMWNNKPTIDSIEILKKRNYTIIYPEVGQLASLHKGKGRFANLNKIMNGIKKLFDYNLILENKKVLVTAGPTQEAIDPIRFISNKSSGKMGYALAKSAKDFGGEVTLVSGPVKLDKIVGVNHIDITTAEMMANSIRNLTKEINFDYIFMVAAVSDYTPQNYSTDKLKKNDKILTMDFIKTTDILQSIISKTKAIKIGFALETNNGEINAINKLKSKLLDYIILNFANEEGAGCESDTNHIYIYSKDGQKKEFQKDTKRRLSEKIITYILNNEN